MSDDLDHVVWSALSGRQRNLGTATLRCAAYRRDISPFAAFASEPVAGDWDELAAIVGPDREVAFTPDELAPPPSWIVEEVGYGFQMVGDRFAVSRRAAAPSVTVRELTESDVDDVFALIAVARPGPFERRTILFGDFLGICYDGALVAMVGTRMRISGWTEISGLATHPAFRGRGFGERLVRDVSARILDRGEQPFLHVAAANPAIRLYELLGFRVRRETRFTFLVSPKSH